MARALDLVTLDATTSQMTSIMSADILDRMETIFEFEDGNGRAVDVDKYRLVLRNLVGFADIHPLAHTTWT